ncbi:LuxR C-terminal-related transcriptional regulator [Streptomyces sp. NPDC012438]|uniref:LuxR C-terminal-related transcriptional regulator n=1 Tax=Streptomyces sp. NPDC012438 TaxID=3364833 RepID=UPI0036EBFF47
MSTTETTATAAVDVDVEAAAVITARVSALLGRRLTPAEAERLGTAALQALRADGWTVQADFTRHRVHPQLCAFDPTLLAGLARGCSTHEIAAATGIPHATLRHRIQRLRGRIGAVNTAHAVAIAYRSGWMAGLDPEPRGPITLSTRQRQILGLIADGHTNEAISTRIDVCRDSVITHIRRLYSVLDASRPGGPPTAARPRAVALGYQHGLLPLPTAPTATAV